MNPKTINSPHPPPHGCEVAPRLAKEGGRQSRAKASVEARRASGDENGTPAQRSLKSTAKAHYLQTSIAKADKTERPSNQLGTLQMFLSDQLIDPGAQQHFVDIALNLMVTGIPSSNKCQMVH
jgi:hypothetical protein